MATTDNPNVKKRKVGKIISWFFGVIFIIIGFGGLISSDFIAGLSMIFLGCILLPIITDMMKNKFNFKIHLGVKIALFVVVFIIIGITAENDDINSQLKQNVNTAITQSNNNENIGTNVENIITEQALREDTTKAKQKTNQCPKQGMLQSDWSYCVDLCDKYHEGNYSINRCEGICNTMERGDDRLEQAIGYRSEVTNLEKRISKYRCLICRDCTQKQLKEIEEKKKEDEEKARISKLRETCREKCRVEVNNKYEKYCSPNQHTTECSRQYDNCLGRMSCNSLE